jgi:hypothetical protein
MKLLKVVLVACSLSAAIAHAQTAVSTDAKANTDVQQIAQSNVTPSESRIARHASAAAQKGNECVGPVSFCNIFFGS